jgi:hypothetical protein
LIVASRTRDVPAESDLDRALHVANEALRMVDKPGLFPVDEARWRTLWEMAGADRSILRSAASHCESLANRDALVRTWKDPTGPTGERRHHRPDPLALEAAELLHQAAADGVAGE